MLNPKGGVVVEHPFRQIPTLGALDFYVKYQSDVLPRFGGDFGQYIRYLGRPVHVDGELCKVLVHEDDFAQGVHVVGKFGDEFAKGKGEEFFYYLLPVFVYFTAVLNDGRPFLCKIISL